MSSYTSESGSMDFTSTATSLMPARLFWSCPGLPGLFLRLVIIFKTCRYVGFVVSSIAVLRLLTLLHGGSCAVFGCFFPPPVASFVFRWSLLCF